MKSSCGKLRAAAQLRHPNIVSVHEVGRTDETVYIVSDLVRGVTLADWSAIRTPSPRESAEICRRIAEALDHAHQAGIVHRDLKPGNIMVDAGLQPHIMDFGLAKRDVGEVTMTIEGQVLGTPAYMAPEQAMGQAHQCSPCTDIYSLGVILFELLTGELPFRGNTNMLIHQVLNDEPPSPRRLNNHVPLDLETICLRCLEKEPARRYASARDLADELDRFLSEQPILSRPIGPLTRAARWCRRHRAIAGLIAAMIVVLIAGSSISTYFALLAAGFRGQAEGFRREAEQKENEVQDTRRRSKDLGVTASSFFDAASAFMRAPFNQQLQVAAPLWGTHPLDALRLLEDEYRCPTTLRDVAWRLYHAQPLRPDHLVWIPPRQLSAVAFAADSQSLGLLDQQDTLWILKPDAGGRWRVTAHDVVPSLDRIAQLQNRDAEAGTSGAEVKVETDRNGPFALAILPQQLTVLAATASGLQHWSIGDAKWRPWIATADWPAGQIHRLAVSPLGQRVATVIQERATDGRITSQTICLVNADSERIVWSRPADGLVIEDMLLVSDDDGGLVVRDAAGSWQRWSESSTVPWTEGPIAASRWLDACGPWRVVLREGLSLYRGASPHAATELRFPGDSLSACALSPDHTWLVATSDTGGLGFYKLQRPAGQWSTELNDASSMEFSPDAENLAVVAQQKIHFFDPVSGQAREPLITDGVVRQLAWSPNGRRLAYCQQDGRARVVDLAGGRAQLDVESPGRIRCVMFQSDDQVLLGDEDGRLMLWDSSSLQQRELAKFDVPVVDLAQCSDVGVALVAAGSVVHVLRTNGDPIALSADDVDIDKVTILRSGDGLLVRSIDGQVRRWRVNWSTGASQREQLATVGTGRGTAEISPDGQTLATLDQSRVMFWDAKTGDFRGALASSTGPLRLARFCSRPLEATDRIAVCDDQGRLQMWIGDELPRQPSAYLGGVVRAMIGLPGTSQIVCVGDLPALSLVDPPADFSRQWTFRERPALHLDFSLRRRDHAGGWQLAWRHRYLSPADGDRRIHLATVVSVGRADYRSAVGTRRAPFSRRHTRRSYRFLAARSRSLCCGSRRANERNEWIATSMLLAPDGKTCWIGDDRGQLQRWNGNETSGHWQTSAIQPLHQGSVRGLKWLKVGIIASVGDDGKLQVWDTVQNVLIAGTDQPSPSCLATEPIRGLIAIGCGDDIHVWRFIDGQLRRQGPPLSEHRGQIVALTFTAEGNTLISSSEDRSVKMWSLQTTVTGPAESPVPESVRKMFEQQRSRSKSPAPRINVYQVPVRRSVVRRRRKPGRT